MLQDMSRRRGRCHSRQRERQHEDWVCGRMRGGGSNRQQGCLIWSLSERPTNCSGNMARLLRRGMLGRRRSGRGIDVLSDGREVPSGRDRPVFLGRLAVQGGSGRGHGDDLERRAVGGNGRHAPRRQPHDPGRLRGRSWQLGPLTSGRLWHPATQAAIPPPWRALRRSRRG